MSQEILITMAALMRDVRQEEFRIHESEMLHLAPLERAA